jgi:NADPH:quinone reductase-like Zn-dependent oxidoreductase
MGGGRRPVRRGRDRVGAVHAVQPKQGETVVISGAAGGVGSLAVQLARRTGATVIGLASESNHQWLKSHGVIPVAYGDGVADRIKAVAPAGVDAFIDTYGDGYVELALALGVAATRHGACLSEAEQGAGVVVEDGPGGARVDLGVVDVVDRAQEDVPVLVSEVGSQ